MVTSNAIAHSRPAKNLSAPAIRANCGSTLPPFYRTFGSLPETNLFEVSVKYASGFTTLRFFPSHLTKRVADFSRGLYHTVGYRVSNGVLAHKIPADHWHINSPQPTWKSSQNCHSERGPLSHLPITNKKGAYAESIGIGPDLPALV